MVRSSNACGVGAAIGVIFGCMTLYGQTVVILSPAATPASGQAGITSISVTGSGFPTGNILPANTDVRLEPAGGGSVTTTKATGVVTVVGTTRRVTFLIPSSIVVTSATPYLVSISGTTSEGAAFASSNKSTLTINAPPRISSVTPNAGQAGQNVPVTITAVGTNFVSNSTMANFGPGISVGSAAEGALGPVSVTSPTTATAQLRINPAATIGPRNVLVQTGVQQAVLSAGFSVTPATSNGPTITDFTPKSAPAGTLVTVTGTNLSPNPEVTVIRQGGGAIAAPLSNVQATSLTFTIPAGAATGPISVTVNAKSVVSTVPLTIVASKHFTLTAMPATADLIRGQSVSFAVRINSTTGFGQLASLNVSGVPTGITASLKPQQITAGQTSVLTLTAPVGQPVGAANLAISAAASVDGLPLSEAASVQVNILAPTTSFIGRTVVDDPLQTSLAGVTVTMLGKDGSGGTTGCTGVAISDAAGNFALRNLPQSCVGRQLVGFNGLTATSPPGDYAGVNLVYTLVSGQVTASPVLVHLPRIDDKETFLVQQNSSTDQSYSFRSIPGLSVTVYRNTTFSMPDGAQPNPFPLVGVQVPIDRLPDAKPPVPTMLNVFIVAFQPANAKASQPVAVYYPNTIHTRPGTSMTMMTLDPTRGQMVPYGTGVVSSNGSQIVPDLDPAFPGKRYGIVNFDWHGPMPPPPPPSEDRPPDSCPLTSLPAGPSCSQCVGAATSSPVHYSSGIEAYTRTDLSFGGARGQVGIERVYRTLSNNTGPFGRGGNHTYGYSLDTLTPQTAGLINLVTPEWSRIPFTRQGTQLTNSSLMLGAVMSTKADNRVTIRFKDGTVWEFSPATAQAFPWIESITDANGNSIVITRDSARPARITHITDPVGRSLVVASDTQDRITSVTDPIGRVVSYTYNSLGALATVTDPEGGITRYEYEAADRLTREIDARNLVVMENTFDSNGRIVQQKHADGGVHMMAYTLLNPTAPASPVIQTVITDPLGRRTTYRFNPEQHLTDVTDSLGQHRIFERNAGRNLITAIRGGGGCATCGSPGAGDVSFTYDEATGNVLSQTDALGHTTHFAYEPAFNKIESITDPLEHVTRFAYDSRGNLTRRTDANNHSQTYTYDAFGLMVEVIDPANNKTRYEYDTPGNLIAVVDANGKRTMLLYDGVSRQIATMDNLGRTSTTLYDKLNRVIRQTDAKGGRTQFSYDAVGNLTKIISAREKQTQFTYDGMNRLTLRTDAASRTDTRTYDLNGNVTHFLDRRGQLSVFTYDSNDRLSSEIYQDSIVIRSYDHAGRLTNVDDSRGGLFQFGYDSTGALLTAIGPLGAVVYVRDELGRVRIRQVVGSQSVAYTYDLVGNVASAAAPIASVSYTYDSRDLLKTIDRKNGVTTSQQFDQVGRLLSIAHNRGNTQLAALSYTYDASGYRTHQTTTVGGAFVTQSALATYDDSDQILSRSNSTFTHDENGNLTSETDSTGTVRYIWDSRNRLSSIVAAGQTMSFSYDFSGNLIRQYEIGGSNRSRSFILDDLTNIAQIDDAYVLTGRVIDRHEAVVSEGSAEYGLSDAINSTIVTVDSAGAVTSGFQYEPFGDVSRVGPETRFAFQFTGRIAIAQNTLYLRARSYNTLTTRFIQEDPLDFRGGINLYSYAFNSPTNLTDPMGLSPQCISRGVALLEIVPCVFAHEAYCEAKFGSPCRAKCAGVCDLEDPIGVQACLHGCTDRYIKCLQGSPLRCVRDIVKF